MHHLLDAHSIESLDFEHIHGYRILVSDVGIIIKISCAGNDDATTLPQDFP